MIEQAEKVGCCKYKLIIMDIEMPEINGIEAVRIIRRKGFTGVVIGFTANSSEDNYQDCKESGMDTVLLKPSTPHNIVETVQKFMLQKHFN